MEPIGKHGLVRYAKDAQGVARIELPNAPANAYSYEMMQDLDASRIAASRSCIISYEYAFAGADIAMLGRLTVRQKYMFCLHANETMLRLEHTPKIVIAAIEGHCVGGGMEIAMSADLRVAAKGTGRMGLPEVALGVLPGTGGTQRLARMVGKAKAIELMTEGRLVDFDEAKALGLVNHVWEKDGFLDRATEYARSFCPPHRASMAVGHIKRAVQTGAEMAIEQGLALERELQQRLFESADAKEGIAAYNEKRQPSFGGK